MSENEHFRKLAEMAIGASRDGRDVKREAHVKQLDWENWSQREKEVYSAAFLFPDPEIPLTSHFMVSGVALDLKGYRRTTRIIDPEGGVWLVAEGTRPLRTT